MHIVKRHSLDTNLYNIVDLCADHIGHIGEKYADIQYWEERENTQKDAYFFLLKEPNENPKGFLDLTLYGEHGHQFWWANVCVSRVPCWGHQLYRFPTVPYFCTASPRNHAVRKAMNKIDSKVLGYVTVESDQGSRRFILYLVNGGIHDSTHRINNLNDPLVRRVQNHIRNQKS